MIVVGQWLNVDKMTPTAYSLSVWTSEEDKEEIFQVPMNSICFKKFNLKTKIN